MTLLAFLAVKPLPPAVLSIQYFRMQKKHFPFRFKGSENNIKAINLNRSFLMARLGRCWRSMGFLNTSVNPLKCFAFFGTGNGKPCFTRSVMYQNCWGTLMSCFVSSEILMTSHDFWASSDSNPEWRPPQWTQSHDFRVVLFCYNYGFFLMIKKHNWSAAGDFFYKSGLRSQNFVVF